MFAFCANLQTMWVQRTMVDRFISRQTSSYIIELSEDDMNAVGLRGMLMGIH